MPAHRGDPAVAAGELSHQDRPLFHAEALDNQFVMVQEQLLLLGHCRLWRDRLAAKGGLGLMKQPRPGQAGAADHDAVHPIAAHGIGDRLRGGKVAVSDQGNATQVRLD